MTVTRAKLFLLTFTCLLIGWGGTVAAGEPKVIHTKGGGRIEGEIIREETGFIEVKTSYGKVKVNRTDIMKIEKGVSKETRFTEMRKQIKDTDAKELIKLAKWCQKNSLALQEEQTYLEAQEIAGAHWADVTLWLAEIYRDRKDYREGVEQLTALAMRCNSEQAWSELRKAEDELREKRLYHWREGKREEAENNLSEAIRHYRRALIRCVREKPQFEGDVAKEEIQQALIACRINYLNRLAPSKTKAGLLESDPGGINWHFYFRPKNLRSQSWGMSLEQLRVDLELLDGRWIALSGVYQSLSEHNEERVRAVTLCEGGHPELAVAAYGETAKVIHKNLLSRASGRDDYHTELLDKYPYGEAEKQFSALAPGDKVVCYGRLRVREKLMPRFIFEVWSVEVFSDPDAVKLAEMLKKPMRCDFAETPLEKALEFIRMITGVEMEFEQGETPELAVTLGSDGRSTGAIVSKLARECGLEWTRNGCKVLMKKKLDEREELLRKQVIRLATDNAE
jgi:tetratricopeptide (TPR) repeat protein